MDFSIWQWAILITVTLVAAVAQTTIGFGFALMAVPMFILVLEVDMAIQLTLILTMVMSVVMMFLVYKDIPRIPVRNLTIGSVFGFPLGLLFFSIATAELIRIVVAISILLALSVAYIKKNRLDKNNVNINTSKNESGHLDHQTGLSIFAGIVSGTMVTSIAMAGPAIAVYANAVGFDKSKTRATIFCVFVISYSCAIAMHGVIHGFGRNALLASAYLLPVALFGVALGQFVVGRISEKLFSRLLNFTLISVAIYLIYSVVIG